MKTSLVELEKFIGPSSSRTNNKFLNDVVHGLSQYPKVLPYHYLYNDRGSELFEEIMNLPEYYLSRIEEEILFSNRWRLIEEMNDKPFELFDLGAGNGKKTKVLLKTFIEAKKVGKYTPVDHCSCALASLTNQVHEQWPHLNINPLSMDYFLALNSFKESAHIPKLILFLGSSIGNFNFKEATLFLKTLRKCLNVEDRLLIGFDLRKDPQEILEAYSDRQGVTSKFNLNLLERINTELDGDIILENFRHFENYDPQSGIASSYLVSTTSQTIHLESGLRSFAIKAWETIHTEISLKYSREEIDRLARDSGFTPVRSFRDSENRFEDSLWKINPGMAS